MASCESFLTCKRLHVLMRCSTSTQMPTGMKIMESLQAAYLGHTKHLGNLSAGQ